MANTIGTTSILNIVVNMFNAAPGAANLASLEAYTAAQSSTYSLEQLANDLANSPLYTAQYAGMNNAAKAEALASQFGLTKNMFGLYDTVEEQTAYNFFSTQLNAGATTQSLQLAAMTFLADTANSAAYPVASATMLNKQSAATYYSVTKAKSANTIDELKAVLSNVTNNAATVVTIKATIDAMGTVTATTTTLTDGRDTVTGTSADDMFIAHVGQNKDGSIANALSTGDVINGGAGTDTLTASIMNDNEVDSGANFDVNARTTSIEVVKLEILDEGVVVDAGNMDSVKEFWSVNSDDSGLVLEDVRTGAAQITKDITFGMKDVDFESDLTAMFDSNSFKNSGSITSNSQILIEAGYEDAPVGVTNANPTKDLFIKVKFTHDGKTFDSGYLNTSTNATDAYPDTYAGLKDLIDATLDAQGFTNLTVEFGNDITTIVTEAGVKQLQVTAKQIYIKDPAGKAFSAVTSAAGAESTDATSDVASRILASDPSVTSTLIESNLILDNAGRGSTAGEVMIGAMSNSNAGIEKFNVMVDRSSAIEKLGTTNAKLQQIAITSLTNNGDLEIGQLDSNIVLVDASAFKGANLMLGTTVEASRAHTDIDNADNTAIATVADVVNLKTLSANIASNVTFMGATTEAALTSSGNTFTYTTGSGNDTIDVNLDGDSVDSKGESFAINAGNGTNRVIVELEDETTVSYTTMAGLKNMNITTGSGVDTITNSGVAQFDIKAGAGSDFVVIESRNDADVDGVPTAAVPQVSTLLINTAGVLNATDIFSVNVGGTTYSAATVALLNTAIDAGPLSSALVGSTITITGLATGAAFTVSNFSFFDDTATVNTANAIINTTTAGSLAVAGGADVAGNATTGTWTVSVTDEDASAALATFVDRVLYQAKVTVNFAGFEAQATVATTAANNFVATQIDINTAIIAAITASPELSKMLTTTLTTDAKGLTIKSTVEGNNDFTIDLFQPTAVAVATTNAREVFVADADVNALRTGLITTLDLGTADSSAVVGTEVSDDSASVVLKADIINVMTGVTTPVTGNTGDGHLAAAGTATLANVGSTNDAGAYTFFASAAADGTDETNVENDSVIDMGAGANDLLVLNSDAGSVQTVKFTAAWDKVSIVNFFTTDATGNGVDGIADITNTGNHSDAVEGLNKIDFTAWLDDKTDSSATPTGNSESAQRVATTDAVVAAATAGVVVTAANQVVIVNDFAVGADATENWSGLTAATLSATLNGTAAGTAASGWGNLTLNTAAFDYVADTADNRIDSITDITLATDTAKIDSMFMIENYDNQGEYKVFNVEWSHVDGTVAGSQELATVTLVGTIDFGETVDNTGGNVLFA